MELHKKGFNLNKNITSKKSKEKQEKERAKNKYVVVSVGAHLAVFLEVILRFSYTNKNVSLQFQFFLLLSSKFVIVTLCSSIPFCSWRRSSSKKWDLLPAKVAITICRLRFCWSAIQLSAKVVFFSASSLLILIILPLPLVRFCFPSNQPNPTFLLRKGTCFLLISCLKKCFSVHNLFGFVKKLKGKEEY